MQCGAVRRACCLPTSEVAGARAPALYPGDHGPAPHWSRHTPRDAWPVLYGCHCFPPRCPPVPRSAPYPPLPPPRSLSVQRNDSASSLLTLLTGPCL